MIKIFHISASNISNWNNQMLCNFTQLRGNSWMSSITVGLLSIRREQMSPSVLSGLTAALATCLRSL